MLLLPSLRSSHAQRADPVRLRVRLHCEHVPRRRLLPSRNWSLDSERQCTRSHTPPVPTIQGILNLSADLLILTIAPLFIAAIGSISIVMCAVRF